MDITSDVPDLTGVPIGRVPDRLRAAMERVLTEAITGVQASRFNSAP